jgi:hypothetical protein
MADEDKPEDGKAEGEEQAKGKQGGKGPLKLLLGVVLLIATGAVLATMAVPGKEKVHKLEGPFFGTLLPDMTVSTPDASNTRYLKFAADAEYAAYDEAYFAGREADPFYQPFLISKAEMIASARQISMSATGAERDQFAAALRVDLEPIVFPVHIGETANPLDLDEVSGLRPGVSHPSATFRGRFYDHVLKVDTTARILQIDDGPEITFRGDEDDLEMRSSLGDTVYVDVTHIEDGFKGEVQVGVHGKLRRIVIKGTIAQ